MSEAQYTTSSQGAIERLTNYIDDFAPVLDQQLFWTSDLPGGKQQQRATVARLKVCGAIASAGMHKKDYQDDHDEYVNQWQWCKHRRELKKYLQERNELPCGDRAHIPPKTNDQGQFICKFCGTAHDRTTIEEAI